MLSGDHLINAVLDLSRIEAGKMELDLESVDVVALVRDIAAVIRPLAVKNGSSRRPRRRAGSPSTGRPVRRVALAEVKDDLSGLLRLAESEGIVITRHGKPAGLLIGFESEEDWFDYRLEHHPEFLRRVAAARSALGEGRGVRLEDLPS